ncbi:MAG: hypothetical protein K9G48_05380 [Reyranella sp.]|nr:hypothetical protein [Reyranella sp.]
MTEFGYFPNSGTERHTKGRPTPIHIDTWGAGPFAITVGGHTISFEDSDRFGPLVLTRGGDIAQEQPGSRSPFWTAYECWRRQGRRLTKDAATCLWRPPARIRRPGPRSIPLDVLGEAFDEKLEGDVEMRDLAQRVRDLVGRESQ